MPLFHADLYRIDEAADLTELGLVEHIGGNSIVLIEWGERFLSELGARGVLVKLEVHEEEGGPTFDFSEKGLAMLSSKSDERSLQA